MCMQWTNDLATTKEIDIGHTRIWTANGTVKEIEW